MAPSSFTYLPAELEDMAECARIFGEAFATDPVFPYFYPGATAETKLARDTKRMEKQFHVEGRRYFKLVDESNGKIAAFSKWYFPHHTDDPEEKVTEPWPADGEAELLDSFFSQLNVGRNKYIQKADMYFMNILAVRPEYQRMGLGSRLLDPVLAQIDEEGKRTYIEASAKGSGLYSKKGWVAIDELVVDTAPYGGKGRESLMLMMRDPREKSV